LIVLVAAAVLEAAEDLTDAITVAGVGETQERLAVELTARLVADCIASISS